MLRYTYKCRLEGQGIGSSTYLEFALDRRVSRVSVYRSGFLRKDASDTEKELMDALADTPGVMSAPIDSDSHNGIINLDGNRILLRTAPLTGKDLDLLAKNVIRKVQRRIAPGESIRRVKIKTLQKQVSELNRRVYGEN